MKGRDLRGGGSLEDEFDKKTLFKDFSEPDLNKTGYLIPLSCGHNGQLSINERTIYEIHLTNAGFIRPSVQDEEYLPQRSSEYD
jgi:hypothetical protein